MGLPVARSDQHTLSIPHPHHLSGVGTDSSLIELAVFSRIPSTGPVEPGGHREGYG